MQWGTPDLMVFVTTKDELRGWIRALECSRQKPRTNRGVVEDIFDNRPRLS